MLCVCVYVRVRLRAYVSRMCVRMRVCAARAHNARVYTCALMEVGVCP